ncbi:MAG: hypothetical protein ABL916_17130 [Burkholderiaceae bacterium]
MNPIDEARDAWLAQALRHAPDANADAPPALSDMILREARAAARPPAASARAASIGPLQWLASAWGWLARPPVAAGFASVMVATLVGVMWWDQPLDETLPRAPEVVSSTPQARAEPAPSAAEAAAPVATDVPGAPKPAEARSESAARGRVAEKKEAEKAARASRHADEPTRQRGAAEAAAAPHAPAPQAAAESSGPVAADTAARSRNELRTFQGGPASPALAKARAADPGDAPVATLRARIAQQPERWRWQREPGAPQPMNAAVQGWLAELERQTMSRWQANADSLARPPAGSLRLLRDGVLQSTLAFSGSAVWIETPGAPGTSVAALPEGLAESLRKALEEATP